MKKKKNGRKHQRGNEHKNNHARMLQQCDNEVQNSHFGAQSILIDYLGPPGRAAVKSQMILRSRLLTSRRQRVTYSTTMNSHKQTTPHSSCNQNSFQDVDLVGSIILPLTVLKQIQHQHSADEAAQARNASADTYQVIGYVGMRVSSTCSRSLGEIVVTDVKLIVIQTAPPTNTCTYPLRGPQVRKEESSTSVKNKDTSTNTSVVANKNLGQTQQR
ncbi:MAG: hypothetical protein EZS28_005051 [Streblomastix strix]|uniref:Uncharacterized protein n=1 Tax=Streblomastix strix TaxID=222440 RepID=A0A5J4WXX9_9EUKA|nr:MAG: hypothetical protein EZS28_005051 [Streblomastix strix]